LGLENPRAQCLGSRVLDSQCPKVRNHVGHRIEGRFVDVDPIGDIVLEFGVCRGQRVGSLTSGLAKSRSPEPRKERVKSSDKSYPFAERVGFWNFGSCEGKRSGFLVSKLPKSQNTI
jgi:hypothetical protein